MVSLVDRATRNGAVDVIFIVDARHDIEDIAVIGEFNDWSPTAHPMSRNDHRFTITVPLRPGRRYRYQLLVNGKRRENDWAADDYEEMPDGAYVSVVDLEPGRTPTHER
jgi:1,4-alpha-glucan branching enzyme